MVDTAVAAESKANLHEDDDDVSSTISFGSLASYPEFSKDTDNLHAEGLHNITDAHSVRTALSNPSEIAAITLVLTKVKERVQVSTHSLTHSCLLTHSLTHLRIAMAHVSATRG